MRAEDVLIGRYAGWMDGWMDVVALEGCEGAMRQRGRCYLKGGIVSRFQR